MHEGSSDLGRKGEATMSPDHDDGDYVYVYRDNHYDLNSKIMVAAIISLSVVVVIVTILHVYARCVLRSQARRRRAAREMRFIMGASQIHSAEPQRMGLHSSVIASLPLFVFKKSHDDDDNVDKMESIECSICLCTLEDGEVAKTLPNCKHIFHAECIDKWLGSHSTCPVCRTEAQPKLVPEPREGVARPPTAPPLERVDSTRSNAEGSSNGGELYSSAKIGGPSSRLSSFRRILSRERSSRQLQSCGENDGILDFERQ